MNGPGLCAEMEQPRGTEPASPRGYWAAPLGRAVGLLGLPAALGCGASIQAVYESDVRFEHCMALDSQPDLQPEIKRACWTEWIASYTYGQTRDRVIHAQQRLTALGGGEEADAPISVTSLIEPLSAPEPQDLHAGPPITSPAAPDAGAAATASGSSAAVAVRTHCLERCIGVRDECRGQCRSAACEKGCTAGFGSCVNECPP
jgi:hypothetical protein